MNDKRSAESDRCHVAYPASDPPPQTSYPGPRTQNPGPITPCPFQLLPALHPLPSGHSPALYPLILLILLLFLGGCITSTPGQSLTVPPIFQLWAGVAGILLIISLGLMLLVYIFGNILMNDRMKGWAKMELFEILYSVIILVFAMYAVTLANSVVEGLVKDSDPYTRCICSESFLTDATGNQIPGTIYSDIQDCHIRLALYFLHTVFKESSDMALKTYISYIWTATMADAQSTMENVFELSGHFTFTPWRGLWAMGNTIKTEVFEKYVLVMLVTMFQEQLIRYIAMAVYPVVFVLGVVLRSFTFTRRLGGLLMAFALSLFFIYPMFYAFGALIINKIKIQNYDPANPNEDPSIAARLYIHGAVPLPNGQTFDLGQEEENARAITEDLVSTGLCPSMRIDRSVADALSDMEASGVGPPRIVLYQDPNAPSSVTPADAEELARRGDAWFGEVSKKRWYDFRVVKMFQTGGELDILARLAFFSVFFGIIGILSAIAAIKNLSILLGGETEIAGLTHLI